MSKLSFKSANEELTDTVNSPVDSEELNADEQEALATNADEETNVNRTRFNKAVEYVQQKFNLSSDFSIISYAEKSKSVIVSVEDKNTTLKVEINNPYEVGIFTI